MSNLLDKKIDGIEKKDMVQVLLNAPSNELKKRVFLLLRQIMKFAYARDYIEANVCYKIDLNEFITKKEVKHLKAITDEDEFKELVRVIWGLDNIFKNVHLGFKFLILTALRIGNVRGLRWEWIDFKDKLIEFPANEMKNKSAFRLPLTDSLVKILEDIGVKESGIVFHTYSEPNKKLSDMAFNMCLRRLGVTTHTTHGFSAEMIEMQLSHSVGSAVARAYQRGDFLEERRKLMQWWERFILS